MSTTEIKSSQIKDGEVKRADLNTATSGSAVVRKLVAGTGITLDSTGADAGTGDVTINSTAVSDHGSLTGLSDDDHSQYPLLAGRSGGQTLIGGTASSNNLNLKSTSNATKGKIVLGNAATTAYDEVNERLGIGTASPTKILEVTSTSSGVLVPRMTTTQRDALSPTASELIYNSTNARFESYLGSNWKPIAATPYVYLQFASVTFTTSDVVYAGVQTYNSDTGVFSWNDSTDTLTVLQSGTYEINFNMDANNTSGTYDGDAILKLFFNGSYYAQSSATVYRSTNGGTGGCQAVIEAAANDYMQWKRRKLNGTSAIIAAGTNLVVKKLK